MYEFTTVFLCIGASGAGNHALYLISRTIHCVIYGRPLDGQPNNLFPEMIYPMVNGEMEEKNNLADKGVLIEISKRGKN